jgi:hypothetical protein
MVMMMKIVMIKRGGKSHGQLGPSGSCLTQEAEIRRIEVQNQPCLENIQHKTGLAE